MPRHISEFLNVEKFPNLDLSIGRHSYGNPRLLYDGEGGVGLEIGSFCSFAENVKIFLGKFGDHPKKTPSTFPIALVLPNARNILSRRSDRRSPSVSIGSDVWVARDVTILQGVNLGHGSIIGAGSVVTKDVLPYCIVAGTPAKAIRRRFPDDVCDRLLRVRWWEYDDKFLNDIAPLFMAEDIEAFLDAFSDTVQNGRV